MTEDFLETEQFKADFAATGAMEFDELEDDEVDFELEQLSVRVQAARAWN
jgi:hypothetical protein